MNKPIRDREQMSPMQGKIFDLAVAYQAFHAALCIDFDKRVRGDHNAIVVWGRLLEEMQAFFGIEIYPTMAIRSHVRLAEMDMKKIDDIMHGDPSCI